MVRLIRPVALLAATAAVITGPRACDQVVPPSSLDPVLEPTKTRPVPERIVEGPLGALRTPNPSDGILAPPLGMDEGPPGGLPLERAIVRPLQVNHDLKARSQEIPKRGPTR